MRDGLNNLKPRVLAYHGYCLTTVRLLPSFLNEEGLHEDSYMESKEYNQPIKCSCRAFSSQIQSRLRAEKKAQCKMRGKGAGHLLSFDQPSTRRRVREAGLMNGAPPQQEAEPRLPAGHWRAAAQPHSAAMQPRQATLAQLQLHPLCPTNTTHCRIPFSTADKVDHLALTYRWGIHVTSEE